MTEFWLCFVPFFVAVDAFGVLPLFVGMTEGMSRADRRRAVLQSVVTATIVALVFLIGWDALLRVLGVTVADFMVAGGILLFVLSIRDLLAGAKGARHPDPASMGAVPLGVPLITGPAVLTTALLLAHQYGFALTATAALVNIAIAGVVFSVADRLVRVLGNTGARAVSKISALILASIAVMMVRRGVFRLIAEAAAS